MAAETLNHGADHCLEVICRTINHVYNICKMSGRTFPRHLVVQSDNTVAQAKNQFFMMFLAYLVLSGRFQTANIFFLVVGHTHEDIDQLFAVVVSLILRCRFETPAELLAFVAKGLRPRFAAKREEIHAETLSAVRDFSGVPTGLPKSNTMIFI